MIIRRKLLKTAVAAGASSLLAFPAIGQGTRKISFLTWNIIDQKELIDGWIQRFQSTRPGVEVEWLDKKGPEFSPFYQTQLAAGTAPDVINTQGALGLEYAAQGALMDLSPLFAREADVKQRYDANYLGNWVFQGRNYMVPFYITKTLLFYNKPMFTKAGLSGAPKSFDEILAFAQKMTNGDASSGFVTLNFDWLYWPLLAMNGVDLVTADLKKTAFNTPKGIEVFDRLAKATQGGAINKISWTGRWVEPNGAFGAGNIGMLHAHSPAYFFFKGQGSWVTPESLGVAHMPGNWATPNSHGLGISKTSKQPELAWDFLKFITDQGQASELGTRRKLLTGNVTVDKATLAMLEKDDPVVYTILKTQLEHTDKMTGNWRFGNDSRIKEAFWPEVQNVLLGRKDAKTALADADKRVSRELGRS
ncbi:MAG: sugar ABC transporter substrate-binding protein [Betaproteobacteria bacterium]